MQKLNKIMEPIVKKAALPKSELLIRFERNNKMFQRLSQKLNSYTSEPHCFSGFEQCNKLKRDFRTFAKHQKQLTDQIQMANEGVSSQLAADLRLHLRRYKELESAIAQYLLDLNFTS